MRRVLEEPITLKELTEAITAMARNKSPGPDGVLTEFFKVMWLVIGAEYLSMIQGAISNGLLPTGVTAGMIALLHKGGGRSSLNNWRPITLLNVTYKIFAKALQIRLQPVLMEVISPDQSAFLPMGFILDNIF
jgi:hypothetical protein